jgi:hypothetical protein
MFTDFFSVENGKLSLSQWAGGAIPGQPDFEAIRFPVLAHFFLVGNRGEV